MENISERLEDALNFALTRQKSSDTKKPHNEKAKTLSANKPFWKFRQMRPGEENHNPIHGEFFTTDALGDLNDVLVREACQNSIDAGMPGKKVKVYFHFRNIDKNDSRHQNVLSNNLNNIWPHLRAEGNGLSNIPDRENNFQYLCIEDFNTVGLEGDPGYDDINAPIDKNSRNHFFFFWRNIARSDKHSDRLGSWGVGKQVFPASSKINSYYAVSCRKSDKLKTLMGKSVLKIHHCPKKCAPFGYWGLFEKDSDMALPVTDSEYISDFSTNMELLRTDESGLSVIIPYVKTALNTDPKQLAAASIKHYLYPVLDDKLEIFVGKNFNPEKNNPDHWYEISKSTIIEQAKTCFRMKLEFMTCWI